MLVYYLFDHIPGAWEKWVLAVLATSRKDADEYIKFQHRTGHYLGFVTSGDVRANCGAVTEAAQKILSQEA